MLRHPIDFIEEILYFALIYIRLETEQNAYIKRMEESTKAFDIDLLAIVERKKDLSVNLKYAELTILSMYEELQIVRATEDTEDDLKASVKELGNTVTEADQLVCIFSYLELVSTFFCICMVLFNTQAFKSYIF